MKARLTYFLLLVFLSFLATPAVQAQLAKGKSKFLGNILKGVKNDGMTADPLFLQYWNQATPENAGKHGLHETSRDVYQSQALDEMYAYCQANNLPFKQHTFLFWCCGADADWLLNLSAAQIRAEMEEWIVYFFNRYPNTAYAEVVNEPFQSPPPAAIRNALGGDTDYAWVRWMYTKARQHAPAGCQLWINENNVLKGGSRVNSYKNLVSLLQQDGTIDAIGVQGHWLENVSASTIKNTLNQLDDLGLPLYVTEYEVNQSDMNAQRDIWAAQFPVMWEHPAVKGVTLWGYKEGQIWRNQAYLVRSDGSERPALQWLRDYLQGSEGAGTIKIRARGISGSERLELRVNGNAVKSWTVGISYATYTATGLSGTGNVKVAFTNDAPGRDLRVDYIQVNGSTQQAEAQAVNTSAWSNGSCGGSYSEWMYCPGHIDFGSLNLNARSSAVASEKSVSVKESDPVQPDALLVYPNPAQYILTVQVPFADARIQLINLHGQIVKSAANDRDDFTLDISQVPPGTYFLKAESPTGSIQRRVVIE